MTASSVAALTACSLTACQAPDRAGPTPAPAAEPAPATTRPIAADRLYAPGPRVRNGTNSDDEPLRRVDAAADPSTGTWTSRTEQDDGTLDRELTLRTKLDGSVELVAMRIVRASTPDVYSFDPPLTLAPPVLPAVAGNADRFESSTSVTVEGPGRSLAGTVSLVLERTADATSPTFTSAMRFDLGMIRVERTATFILDPSAAPGTGTMREEHDRTVRLGPVTVARESRTVVWEPISE